MSKFKSLRYISLFAGIGGFDRAFDDCGMQPVEQVEFDEDRRNILAANWPHVPRRNDVRHISGSSLPAHDVLVGGFPCQGTSSGQRNRLGLADKRSRLFWEFARLIEEAQPQWFIIENPLGFKRGPVGQRDFGTALHHLAQLRYGVAYRVVDARHLGSAQRRNRILIVGHRGDDTGPATRVLADAAGSSGSAGCDHAAQGTTGRLASARGPEQARWYRKARNAQGDWDFSTYVTGPEQEYANTLAGNDHGGVRQRHLVLHGDRARVLTLTEWERLQGFPDGWTETIPTPKKRANALGDAMNVHMARWLGRRLVAAHNSLA